MDMHTQTQTPSMDASRSVSNTPKEDLPILMLGAIGVVYGDIGTSPLYALKESFIGPHPLAVDRLHIFGVLSLIFWSLMFIVTVKCVFVAMRADSYPGT
jgi:KUP system potassium uptake protein